MLKLKKMIDAVHERYSAEQLQRLPQYKRLMSIYESLKPLLPASQQGESSMPLAKKAGMTMDFMGEIICGRSPLLN